MRQTARLLHAHARPPRESATVNLQLRIAFSRPPERRGWNVKACARAYIHFTSSRFVWIDHIHLCALHVKGRKSGCSRSAGEVVAIDAGPVFEWQKCGTDTSSSQLSVLSAHQKVESRHRHPCRSWSYSICRVARRLGRGDQCRSCACATPPKTDLRIYPILHNRKGRRSSSL